MYIYICIYVYIYIYMYIYIYIYRSRGLSLDTRLAKLRHKSLQADAEVRFDSALDRTASETLLRYVCI
jgi:hypothetical protein